GGPPATRRCRPPRRRRGRPRRAAPPAWCRRGGRQPSCAPPPRARRAAVRRRSSPPPPLGRGHLAREPRRVGRSGGPPGPALSPGTTRPSRGQRRDREAETVTQCTPGGVPAVHPVHTGCRGRGGGAQVDAGDAECVGVPPSGRSAEHPAHGDLPTGDVTPGEV